MTGPGVARIEVRCCQAGWTFVRLPQVSRWEHLAPDIDGADPALPDVDEVGVDAYVDALLNQPGQESPSHVLVGRRLLPEVDTAVGSVQRLRWDLRCPTCRLTVPVLDTRLQEVLGKASTLGVSELPLRRLST